MRDLLVGIDVGTTHLKAAAFTPTGQLVAIAHEPTPLRRVGDGGEYDAAELWAGIARCLRQVTENVRPERIASVGIASMAEAGVLLGSEGAPVYPVITWFDPRTRPQAERLAKDPGTAALYRRTGLFVMPKHGLAKLLWIQEHHPDVFARGATWLSMAEWIGFCLTGQRAACPTLAARTLGMDLATRTWATDLLEHLHIPESLLPPLHAEGTEIGAVTSGATALTGLLAGTPVALAGHDHPCAAFAAGVTTPGQMLDSTGTAEAVIGAVHAPILTDGALASEISQGPLPVPGLYGLQAGASASGGSVEWLRRELLGDADYATLTALAESAGEGPSGILFLPHLAGGGPPAVEPAAKGAFVGITYATTKAHLAKAVFEGTCFELRQMVTAMEGLTGAPFERVVVTGGHTHNPLWLQLKADILGRPVAVPAVGEATLLGAALLGAGGVRPTHGDELTLFPRPETAERYNTQYQTYRQLFPALRPLYRSWSP
ncbi:MAG TPA: FGGY family carbohydrate kinase [Symbiobacteriaceae bacterium]|nr:FGGY family carbohydrate kinase [Symbiobacteriaceae bacterium]